MGLKLWLYFFRSGTKPIILMIRRWNHEIFKVIINCFFICFHLYYRRRLLVWNVLSFSDIIWNIVSWMRDEPGNQCSYPLTFCRSVSLPSTCHHSTSYHLAVNAFDNWENNERDHLFDGFHSTVLYYCLFFKNIFSKWHTYFWLYEWFYL